MNDVSISKKSGLYLSAIALVTFIPGLALGLFRNANVLLLPRGLVELVFPATVLPFESASVSILLEVERRLGRPEMNGVQPDIFTQQVFVMALLCFLAVLGILTIQAFADALQPEALQTKVSAIVKILLISELARVLLSFVMTLDRAAFARTLPIERVMLPFAYFAAPFGLIFFTCLLAVGFWLLSAMAFRHVLST